MDILIIVATWRATLLQIIKIVKSLNLYTLNQHLDHSTGSGSEKLETLKRAQPMKHKNKFGICIRF